MCRKNVNAIVKLYDYVSIGNSQNGNSLFKNQFDTIKVSFDENSKPFIGGFSIITDINLLGTSKEENKAQNYIESKIPARFKIRLTKLNKNQDMQYSWDLDTFEINPSTENIIQKACVSFINHTQVTHIDKIILKENDYIGKYAIKVLISENEQQWIIQSLSNFTICE